MLFLAIKIAVELSQYIINDLEIESTSLSPEMKLFNHIPFEVASKHETNSASIVKVAVKDYLTLLQDIAPLANINM